MDECTGGCIDGCMDACTDECTDELTNVRRCTPLYGRICTDPTRPDPTRKAKSEALTYTPSGHGLDGVLGGAVRRNEVEREEADGKQLPCSRVPEPD